MPPTPNAVEVEETNVEETSTNVEETNEVENTAADLQVKDEPVNTAVNGVQAENLFYVVGTKGAGKGKAKLMFKMPLDVPNPFANFARIVGLTAFIKVVYDDVIKAACTHATKAATEETDGKKTVSLVKFGEGLVDYFKPTTRGGSGIRELTKKFHALTHEVTPYIISAMNPAEAGKYSDEEHKFWQNKVLEWKNLESKVLGQKTSAGKRAKKEAPALQQEEQKAA